MKKSCKAFFSGLLIAILATGCTPKTDAIHEKIHNKFYNMPSYTAKCTLTVNSNKNQNTYNFLCIYNSKQEQYKLQYTDTTVILNKDNAHIIKDGEVFDTPTTDDDMLIFLNSFFKSYYVGENTSMSVGVSENGNTLLECELVNPTPKGSSMKLWIDNKTVTPVEMKLYSKDGDEVFKLVFEEFEFKEPDEGEFNY